MKVLILSPYPESLAETVTRSGDRPLCFNAPISLDHIVENDVDFIISYGYRTILGADIIRHLERRIINLHISYLPWNRGVYPNVWSWVEGTPKGVSIHVIDEGIDTGGLIAREEARFGPDQTLDSTYQSLRVQIERLFDQRWASVPPRLGQRRPSGDHAGAGGSLRHRARGRDDPALRKLCRHP
jgi:hypothetical protein